MKKSILQFHVKIYSIFIITLLALLANSGLYAQVLATFPLRTANAVNNNTP